MKPLYDHIKTKINNDLPKYKTVRIYNRQDIDLIERNNEVIIYPAIFVEMIVEGVNRLAMDVKDFDMVVRFRFMYESYKHERGNNLDNMDEFRATMDRFRGNEADPVQFTSMEEIATEIDDEHDQINMPMIDYRTVYRHVNTYNKRNLGQLINTPAAVINKEIL
jgi:hypothetical protein